MDRAQASLYQQLGQQIKALWGNGNGQKAGEAPTIVAAATKEPEAGQTPPASAHHCQEHQTEHKRFEKDGRVWYSHRAGSTWCRDKT